VCVVYGVVWGRQVVGCGGLWCNVAGIGVSHCGGGKQREYFVGRKEGVW